MQAARQNNIHNIASQLLLSLALVLLSVVQRGDCLAPYQKGGSVSKPIFESPAMKPRGKEEAALPYPRETVLQPAYGIKQKHEASLLAMDGVEGVGIGQDQIGNEAIVVYVRDQGVADRLPQNLDGMSVQVIVTGPIEASKTSSK